MAQYVARSTIKFKNEQLYKQWQRFAVEYDNHEEALKELLRHYRTSEEVAGGKNFS